MVLAWLWPGFGLASLAFACNNSYYICTAIWEKMKFKAQKIN